MCDVLDNIMLINALNLCVCVCVCVCILFIFHTTTTLQQKHTQQNNTHTQTHTHTVTKKEMRELSDIYASLFESGFTKKSFRQFAISVCPHKPLHASFCNRIFHAITNQDRTLSFSGVNYIFHHCCIQHLFDCVCVLWRLCVCVFVRVCVSLSLSLFVLLSACFD